MNTNVLYYGDNLDVLRRHIPDASVDLIYLDPPFNSSRSYNVLFRESSGVASEAQLEAFEDTWQWVPKTAQAYEEIVTGPHQQVARMLKAMVEGLGHNDVTAYLTMMVVRLIELHRALKDTGSIYLHCDPTAGSYLRVLMDAVFGPRNFRNEVIWPRTNAHHDAKRYGRIHDLLLFYTKSESFTWNSQYSAYTDTQLAEHYRHVEPETGRLFRLSDLSANKPGGDVEYEWKGVRPPKGRYWAYSKANMERFDAEGELYYTSKGHPFLKQYLDEMTGNPAQDIWSDVPFIHGSSKELLGYKTQKPLALLERVINASSNPGDVVLDPFCGCGTAVHAAHKLGRRWVGIDVTHLAIGLVRRRMQDAFPGIAIEVIGEPVDLASAQELAKRDKYQFQWWALDRLGAQPVAGKKKGADKGIDGVIPFFAGPKEDYKRAIVSVKGGEKVHVDMVRDLVGVLQREKEPIGVLLTLEPPTQPMITEAAAAGIYHNDFWKKDYPRVQILTIEEMLAGKRPHTPQTKSPGAQQSPFAKAPVEHEQSAQSNF